MFSDGSKYEDLSKVVIFIQDNLEALIHFLIRSLFLLRIT